MELRKSFDEDASGYDRYRPGYPPALFEDVFAFAALPGNARVLEMGIGTGQATEPFLRHGCRVEAVDVGENMCAFAARRFRSYENFNVRCCDFMDVKGQGEYDLIYAATAFHWLPEEGWEQLRRLLKPGGTAALFRNYPCPEHEPGESARVNRRVYERYTPPRGARKEFCLADCRPWEEKLRQYGFTEIHSRLYERNRTLTAEDYVGLLNSYSDHNALPEEVRAAFDRDMLTELREIGGLIRIHDSIPLTLAKKQ